MSLKWMWGFEIGADKSFYEGSEWGAATVEGNPSGTSDQFWNIDTTNLVDYKANFPHQPSSSVGGGYYSLKIDTEIESLRAPIGNPQLMASIYPFGIMTPPLGTLFTGSLSFSMYADLDQTQWPLSQSLGGGGMSTLYLQRFLALYPNETELQPISFTGASQGAGLNQMSALPPQLQLFMFRTGSGGVAEDKILACIATGGAGSGADSTMPWNPLTDYLYTSIDVPWTELITDAIANGGDFDGYYVYTSSAGTYVSGNQWTKVGLEYNPHNINGSLKVWLNGSLAINETGVPTGYTGSVGGAGGPGVLDNIDEWGRILFTTTPFYGSPSPFLMDISSTLKPSNFWYDHVCVFDNQPSSDASSTTASIFVQGLKPTGDGPIGNFTGNDLAVTNLYNYVNDPNAAMETSYITGETTTSASFDLQNVNIIEEGAKLWDLTTIKSFVGIGVVNAYENIGAANITVNSSMFESSQALGPNYSVAPTAKQMSLFVSGTDPGGSNWVLATVNSLKGGIKIS